MARSGGGLELNPCRLLEDRVDRVGFKLRRWGDFACTVSKAKMESAESDVRSSSHSNRSFTVACAAGSQRGAHRALTHSHTHTLIHTY